MNWQTVFANCVLFCSSQSYSVNEIIHDIDRVFAEIPVQSCSVGMLLNYSSDELEFWCGIDGIWEMLQWQSCCFDSQEDRH